MGDESVEDRANDYANDHANDHANDYARDLGVIEAITQVTRSCPNGAVVSAAERALEAIKNGGRDELRTQAYFVLIAIKGWRGERSRQVHRSLSRFLEQSESGSTRSAPGSDPTDPGPLPADRFPSRSRS